MSAPAPQSTRSRLLAEMKQLEESMARLQRDAAEAFRGDRLPGSYVELEIGGHRALAPAASVLEILRLVATTPLPGAPEVVLGTFVHRGQAVTAIDLARWLGIEREPGLDAHLVVFGASRPFALVVDRAASILQAPELVGACEDVPDPWQGGGLVAALCRTEAGVVPLLRMAPFIVLAGDLAG